MVSNEKTTLMWSVSVVILVLVSSANRVVALSLNAISEDVASTLDIRTMHGISSGKHLETTANCNCGENSNGCSLKNGLKICSCKLGYLQSNGTCRKECRSWPLDACKNGGKCKNRVCQCPPGTQGDRCEVVTAIEDRWSASATCGSYYDQVCAYDPYTETSSCQYIKKDYVYDDFHKECKKCDCGSHGVCFFSDGSKRCNCEFGFGVRLEDNVDDLKCEPCSCGTFGKCHWDGNGKETCTCLTGYGLKSGQCTECNCGQHGKCEFNYNDEEVCTCTDGFEMVDEKCRDINECEYDPTCPIHSKCVNTYGSHECVCEDGYRPLVSYHEIKKHGCTDINECEDVSFCPYRDTTDCINTPGSFYCACKKGHFNEQKSLIPIVGCQKDLRSWRVGTIVVVVGFCIAVFVIVILLILKRRASS